MTSPLSRLVHKVAFATGYSRRAATRRSAARVLMFHGVGGDAFPASKLRAVLTYCKRNFDVVPLGGLAERLRSGDGANALALTFDDGLRNNATLAAPLLAELSLSATFFVCPTLLDEGRWLWNHEVRERLHSMSVADRTTVRVHDIEAAIERMKAMDLPSREAEETRIRDATPHFEPDAAQRAAFDMMSWDDLRALDERVVTVGSHSLSHPILPTLDDDGLLREIRDSRARLEARLDRTVDLFCYPNGSEDDRVRDCVAAHYRAAVTTAPGFATDGDDPYRLGRIGAVPDLAELAWRLHRP